MSSTLPPTNRDRARLVLDASVVGGIVSLAVGLAALLLERPPVPWLETAFAFGGLWLGLGLLGWSGSVMVGRTIESLQERMGTNTHWTEADSRRAMARLGGFGAGMMVMSALLGTLLV